MGYKLGHFNEVHVSEISELLERLRRGAELVAVATTGAAGSELDYVPGPGKWSVRQITCHLADSELVGAIRIRRLIAEENPTLMAFNQDAWASGLDYTRRKISHAIEGFRRTRAETYELLKDLPESAFERTGTHSERGPVTLLDVVRGFANHAENHAAQIRETRKLYKQSRASA